MSMTNLHLDLPFGHEPEQRRTTGGGVDLDHYLLQSRRARSLAFRSLAAAVAAHAARGTRRIAGYRLTGATRRGQSTAGA